jgi:type I restriction enzyme, S subunit
MIEDLPEQWIITTIDQVTINILQRQPQQDESFFYIDIGSIDREQKQIVTPQKMLGQDAPSRARKVVHTGDVLVSTIRPNLNAVAMVAAELNNQIASTGFDVLRAPNIDPRWLFYIVRTTDFVQTMSELVQGALYPAIRSKDVRSFEIPIAPLNEQKRIADKLDRLLAKVDNCRERLDRIHHMLKLFRRSILDLATSGQLTEDWANHKEWSSSTLGELLVDLRYGTSKKSFYEGNTPVLRIPNIQNGHISIVDLKYGEFDTKEIEALALRMDDILIIRSNGSVDLVGKAAIIDKQNEGYLFAGYLIRLRLRKELILSK